MDSFQRVQAMIREARTWLDKAQESYRSTNPIRGELDLHLAQAEIQRACEISRSLCLNFSLKESEIKRERSKAWMRYCSMGAVAAVIILVFSVSMGLFLYSDGAKIRNRSLLVGSFMPEPVAVSATKGNAGAENGKHQVPASAAGSIQRQRPVFATVAASKGTAYKGSDNIGDRLRFDVDLHPGIPADTSDVSRFYEIPNLRDNQWRNASTSSWGEDRIIRSSFPSFSRKISDEGGR